MATRKKQAAASAAASGPSVVKGTHLTVTTDSEGRTTLEWDDDQLLKEVREAIASAELANKKPAVRAKAAPRQRKAKA